MNAATDSDRAPASEETAYLALAEAVDGPAELIELESTGAMYKRTGKTATATITWSAVAGVTGYEVPLALNGKAWTTWRASTGTRVAIKGLARNKPTRIEIRAKDADGPGPASSDTIGWGPAFGM